MQYVERVLKELKEKNPNEPEFHQAATEILNGLKPVIEKHPEYEKRRFWNVSPSRSGSFCSAFPGWTTRERYT